MNTQLALASLVISSSLVSSALCADPVEQGIIGEIAEAVDENYVYPDKGQACAAKIKAMLDSGQFDEARGEVLAGLIRAALIDVTHDLHFNFQAMPEGWTPPSNEEEAQQRQAPSAPYGFRSVERLDGNVGYIDLRGFSNAQYIAETVQSAMRLVQGSDALIFDLRQNGGGDPNAVALITSYLYDPSEPVHLNSLYSRPNDTTTEYWTRDTIDSNLAMPDVPVYVLTSRFTFSAAEEFSYNLRNLKRATIIGETTGGGAHPVDRLLFHSDATDRFYTLILPTARAISPITGTNWEGVGVEPHIACEADDALDQALLDAYSKSLKAGNEQARFGLASINARLNPIELSEDQMREYAGNYTDREIQLKDGKLHYRRVGVSDFRPIACVGEDEFMIEGLTGFILSFARDEQGNLTHIDGIYQQGHSDRSLRASN